ncbi:MAG: hypothetical protein JNK78_03055 [Planctomycetes bacterium]|nr:hypothetical protein [Planctomycetota bacterium]
MDPVRGLAGVDASMRVQDRAAGGNKKDAEAFRRALEQEGGDGDAGRPPEEKTPMRTRLQPQAPTSRKVERNTRHVDVIA